MFSNVVITGCAGFIGSNLVDNLLESGYKVTGIDNFSTGKRNFLNKAINHPNFTLEEGDLLDLNKITPLFVNADIVFHLAANADVRFGVDHPRRDLEQNTIVTYNVLEAMRVNKVKKIAFSSTGSVYGESDVIPTPENAPFPVQTSLYAASKLACEGMISAYCEGFEFQSWIFRFVGILGERYTHGHIFDFYKKLNKDSSNLYILGDGEQRKSYLYIQDCIDAMLIVINNSVDSVNIFNLGVNDYCQVNDSVRWISKELNISPRLEYAGGKRGWVGDNPYIVLDTKKVESLGWKPKYSIHDGVVKTVEYLRLNEWVFD